MKKEGERNCDIAREFEVGESTVRNPVMVGWLLL